MTRTRSRRPPRPCELPTPRDEGLRQDVGELKAAVGLEERERS